MSICSSNPEMFSASVPCRRLSSWATRAIWLRRLWAFQRGKGWPSM
jgi:hypothetical protein